MVTIQTAGMGSPFFLEFKKQASSYFKEKIRVARLALTDVTPAELLAEEATSDESVRGPEARTMKMLSRAAFEVDDYWRIVDVVHRKLPRNDGKHWRESYKALTLLEYLLTHGPESVAREFQADKDAIRKLGLLGHVDDRGFNWGLAAKRRSERVLQLLEEGPRLREERERARKLTRGIEGFGSCRELEAVKDDEGIVAEASRFPIGKANSLCNTTEHRDHEVEAEGLLGEEIGQRQMGGQTKEKKPLKGGGVEERCGGVVDESRPLLC